MAETINTKTYKFKAVINIIGINPFVFVPVKILRALFIEAGKDKGHIPVHGKVNGKNFTQTLVKYSSEWRLYINTVMLPGSPGKTGEKIDIEIAYDPTDRSIKPHSGFIKALNKNKEAKKIFEGLPPYLQKEIVRYISNLKTQESVEKNIKRAIDYLLGKTNFIGRPKLKT